MRARGTTLRPTGAEGVTVVAVAAVAAVGREAGTVPGSCVKLSPARGPRCVAAGGSGACRLSARGLP